jgi:hypothetical protein
MAFRPAMASGTMAAEIGEHDVAEPRRIMPTSPGVAGRRRWRSTYLGPPVRMARAGGAVGDHHGSGTVTGSAPLGAARGAHHRPMPIPVPTMVRSRLLIDLTLPAPWLPGCHRD